MNFKHLMALMLCGTMLLAVPACGDDGPSNPGENPNPTPNPGTHQPSDKEYTPEESKEFLEDVAEEFLNKFNSSDQQKVISLCSYFAEEYGDLEMPENFEIDEEEVYNPASYMAALGQGAKNFDMGAMTRAGYQYIYRVNFPHFTGIYRPAGDEWKKVGNSDDIIFKFYNRNGQDCSIEVKASSNSSNETLDFEDEWYDGYKWNTDTYKYIIQLPREVNVKVKENGVTLAESTIKSEVSISGHRMSADVMTTVANLSAHGVVNGTDTRITSNVTLNVSGTQIMQATATIDGNRMCDYDYIKRHAENETLDALDFFNSGVAKTDILGKVQIDANLTFNEAIMDALEQTYWDYYDGSESYCQQQAQNAINTFKRYLTTNIRYNNTATSQATLDYRIKKENDSYYGWGYIEIVPVLHFNDNTTYEFDNYFGSGFGNVTNLFESLIDSYENAWDR